MTDGRHITLSSARQDWRTPEWFLELVRRVGPIEFDPATTLDNPVGAEHSLAQVLEWHPPLVAPRVVGPCGLSAAWERSGLAFVNPPYGPQLSGPVEPHRPIWRSRKVGGVVVRELVGVGRGWAARIAQETGETLALVPARTETAWWRRLFAWCDWACLWSAHDADEVPRASRAAMLSARSRISFVDPETGEEKGGSNLASTVFYRGPRAARFRRVFGGHGEVVPGRTVLSELLARPARRRRALVGAAQLDLLGGLLA